MQNALDVRHNTELLFPVYDTIKGTGANAQYHVIAWVGFHMTGHEEHGSTGSITGWFTEVVWTGIASTYCDRAAEPRRPRRQPRRLTSKDKEQWHIELETS